MEEKRQLERFNDALVKATPILEDVKKGFFSQKMEVLKENRAKFMEMLKSRVKDVEKIITVKDKTEAQKRYLVVLPLFQGIAAAIENLIHKMETKVELKILFSQKALEEIKELYTIMEEAHRDVRDYVVTKNPVLKNNVKKAWEKVFKLTEEYAIIHEERLIAGVCMPAASYLYLDITDSIKRIVRGLADFVEKV